MTTTTTDTDREFLSPASPRATAPRLSYLARRLAAPAYRPLAWPILAEGIPAHAAAFIARAGMPAGARGASRLRLAARAGGFDASRTVTAALSTRPLAVAFALAEEDGGEIDLYLDRAADIMAGMCLCKGATMAAWGADQSRHGFGCTMPRLSRRTETRVKAAFRIDRAVVEPRTGWLSPSQVALRLDALPYLASQYAAEAAESHRHPLDRARRVAAAVRLDPALAAADYGADDLAALLSEYAATAAADDDGREAWERFADQSDRERNADDRESAEEAEAAEMAQAESRQVNGAADAEATEGAAEVSARCKATHAAKEATKRGDEDGEAAAIAGLAATPPKRRDAEASDAVTNAAAKVTVNRLLVAE